MARTKTNTNKRGDLPAATAAQAGRVLRSSGKVNMIETRFDVPFIADLALREKQIQQNYRPPIAVHKWFARRPGTVFRGLGIGG